MAKEEGRTERAGKVSNISDTARWVAYHRALESERPDALFSDPLARRLAGRQGEAITQRFESHRSDWAFVMRTLAFDELIAAEIARGADLVVNLAAGFDARPYRLDLPADLRWVEVDLPPLIAEKEALLAGEVARCRLERVALDLADVTARQALLARLGREAQHILFLSEGLLIYLAPDEVAALARDLAATRNAHTWVMDLVNRILLKLLSQTWGRALKKAGAPFKFAPREGAHFFEPCGWAESRTISVYKLAAAHRRLPFLMQMAALLPEIRSIQPWGGVLLFERR